MNTRDCQPVIFCRDFQRTEREPSLGRSGCNLERPPAIISTPGYTIHGAASRDGSRSVRLCSLQRGLGFRLLNHAMEPDAVAFRVFEDGNKAMLADGCAGLQD